MNTFLNKHLLKINIPLLAFNFLIILSAFLVASQEHVRVAETLLYIFNISFLLQLLLSILDLVLLLFTRIITVKRVKRLTWVFIIITAIEAVPVIANMTL